MRLRLIRLALIGIGLGILFITPQPTTAQDPSPEPGSIECVGCHEGLRDYWDHSNHARAYSNPDFQEAWRETGNDKACLGCHTTGFDAATGAFALPGVGCTTCHNPVPVNHPDNYIPTNVSSRLCGTCHIETYEQWEDSAHSQQDLTCNQCHNAHLADIRYGSSHALCETCHEDTATAFAATAHAAEGMICTDCHLQVASTTMGEGHGSRPHSFGVDLDTCTQCHEHDQHLTGGAMVAVSDGQDPICYQPDSHLIQQNGDAGVASNVATVPPQAGPLAFIIPAGLALVAGIMLNPLISLLAQWRQQMP